MMVTKQTLHVAGVVRSPQLQYELSEALAEDIGTEVDLRVGGLKAWAPGLLVAERTPSVLLLEIDVDDREDMTALGPLSAEASRSHVPIVATASDLSPATVRQLLREGVADFIPQPIDRAEVLDVLRSADHKARRRQQRSPAQGRVLTFSRATGGAGATTLAVNVAHALACSQRETKVCLIDLDLQFGAVALQLELDPTAGLFDIAQARQSFDPSLFLSSLVEHQSGLRVLPSPSAPLSLEALRPAVVNALLELARVEFDYVIVDLPCALTGWTETVLSHSDLVYLVHAADPAGGVAAAPPARCHRGVRPRGPERAAGPQQDRPVLERRVAAAPGGTGARAPVRLLHPRPVGCPDRCRQPRYARARRPSLQSLRS